MRRSTPTGVVLGTAPLWTTGRHWDSLWTSSASAAATTGEGVDAHRCQQHQCRHHELRGRADAEQPQSVVDGRDDQASE